MLLLIHMYYMCNDYYYYYYYVVTWNKICYAISIIKWIIMYKTRVFFFMEFFVCFNIIFSIRGREPRWLCLYVCILYIPTFIYHNIIIFYLHLLGRYIAWSPLNFRRLIKFRKCVYLYEFKSERILQEYVTDFCTYKHHT